MKYLLLLPVLAFPVISHAKSPVEGELTSNVELIDSIIAAEPLKRTPPKYPIQAAKNGNEGWVKMSFVVDKEGNVVDPVIEDSSGIRGFEKESLRAIKKWKYSPAIRDGKAIEQCQNSVQMDFMLSKEASGARRKFIYQYKEANEALDSGDLDLTQELVSKMEKGKIWNSYEDAWFWVLKSELNKARNNETGQLRSLRRALSIKHPVKGSNKFYSNELHLSLLQEKFVLEIKASLLSDALKTYALINQLPDNEDTVSRLQKYALDAKNVITESPYISVSAEIQKSGNWWHRLSRNRFSFADIQGELDSVELRCDNKREIYTVASDSVWNIPQSWGRCSMMVIGDPQATFSLLELKQDA